MSKFTCGSCNRSFTWKPELAGKRVKCKCGQPLAVPKTDPAEVAEAPDGFEDFSALAAGIADDGPAMAAVADGQGGACPSCGAGVEAAAVICINCGFNLKTGKKLGTKKVSTKALDPDQTAGAGYISRGPRKTLHDEEPPPEKKRLMQILLVAAIGVVIAGVAVAVTLGIKSKRKRDAEIAAAGPGKLERIITITEGNEGGLVGAMKDGSIAGAFDPRKTNKGGGGAVFGGTQEQSKSAQYLPADFDGHTEPRWKSPGAVEARGWIKGDEKRRLAVAKQHDAAVKWIEEVYALGAKEIRIVDPYNDEGDIIVVGLPAEPAKRKKLFEWSTKFHHRVNPLPDVGQLYIMLNFNSKEE